jgi:RecB family endonuclease NucS
MICTKSYDILNSVNGRTTLNYRPPSGPVQVNEARDNLIVVWDILMQNYRAISMTSCDLIQDIAANDFWEYFNENIYPMSPAQKFSFMNS